MDAAASLVTIITVSLQSTKVIYGVVSELRHGSARIDRLVGQLESLLGTLYQVKDIAEQGQKLEDNGAPIPLAVLTNVVSRCSKELGKLQERVIKLKKSTSSRTGQALSAIKVALGSKDIEEIERVISSSKQDLGIQIGILGGRMNLWQDRNARSFHSGIDSNLASLKTSLQNMRNQRVVREAQTESSINHLTSLTEQNLTITRAIASQQAQKFEERLEATLSMSADQCKQMMSVLEQIQVQVSTMGRCSGWDRADANVDNVLVESIDRLCLLASAKPQSISTDQAQEIVDDLEKILLGLEQPKDRLQKSRKRLQDTHNDVADQSRTVKRVRRAISSVQGFDLREGHTACLPRDPNLAYDFYDITTSTGSITVSSSRIRRRPQVSGDVRKETSCTFAGTITVTSKSSKARGKLKLAFLRKSLNTFTATLWSTLSFCSVIPSSSEVFEVIKQGNLEGLKVMVTERTACLSDCDELGRSLLTYALHFPNPSICGFLIEHGADVNSRERMLHRIEEFSPNIYLNTLDQLTAFDRYDDDDSATICARLLLNAGSEPVFDTDYCCSDSYWQRVLGGRWKCLLPSLDPRVVDLESVNHNWGTILLSFLKTPKLYLRDDAIYNYKQALLLLLDEGADVNAHDINGNTCLHVASSQIDKRTLRSVNHNGDTILLSFLKNSVIDRSDNSKEEYLRAFFFLLGNGAHINACDNEGNSSPYALMDSRTLADSEKRLVFEELLNRGADLESINRNGNTTMISFQIQKVPDLVKPASDPAHNLHFFYWRGVRFRLDDVNARDQNGNSHLHAAINTPAFLVPNDKKELLIRELLNRGVDLESVNNNGDTALLALLKISHLHIARTFRQRAISLLLDGGANPNACDHNDKSCLFLALWSGDLDYEENLAIVTELLNRGADIFATTNRGLSIVEWIKNTYCTKLWHNALQGCDKKYQPQVVLLEDHKRSHERNGLKKESFLWTERKYCHKLYHGDLSIPNIPQCQNPRCDWLSKYWT